MGNVKVEHQIPQSLAAGPTRSDSSPRIRVRVTTEKVSKSPPAQEPIETESKDVNEDIIEKDASGNTLYYKYQAGTNKVLMNVKVNPKDNKKPEVPKVTDDDVIVISTKPDGSKQLSFRFDEFTSSLSEEQPQLNQIYEYIVEILQKQTNFLSLDNQADYLTAVARLLESAYFNIGSVDSHSQKMFDKLANALELKKKDTVSSQTEQKSSSVLQDNVLQDANQQKDHV